MFENHKMLSKKLEGRVLMNALPISLDIQGEGGLHSQHTYLYVHTAIVVTA